MQAFAKNPGLQHISEDIFKLLDMKSLMDAHLVNNTWKQVLDHPIFWLKKLKSESNVLEEFLVIMDDFSI